MTVEGSRRIVSRARTAAGFPARLVAVEDRCAAIEVDVVAALAEMRSELATLRSLVAAALDSQTDLASLVGGLLGETGRRVEALEDRIAATPAPRRPDRAGPAPTGSVAP